MEWEKFLEYTKSHDLGIQDTGAYLFRVILHDSLRALNNYLTALDVVNVYPSTSSEAWLLKWERKVRYWVKELLSLVRLYETPLSSFSNWPKNIDKIESILDEIPSMVVESQKLVIVTESDVDIIVEAVISNITGLNSTLQNIHNQRYIQLWRKLVCRDIK